MEHHFFIPKLEEENIDFTDKKIVPFPHFKKHDGYTIVIYFINCYRI